MSEYQKTQIDFSQMNGPFPLLGAFLAVSETLLAVMFFRAADTGERIFVGIIMALLLGAFLIAVVYLGAKVSSAASSQATVLDGLNKPLEPATSEVTKEQIATIAPQKKAASDGSYIIDRPPVNWEIRQLTILNYFAENLRITDEALKKALAERMQSYFPLDATILTFESKRATTIIPIPGKSMFDQRKLPTALEVVIPTRLTVFPLYRALSPLYIERPFEHNFLQALNQLLPQTIITIQSLKIDTTVATNRKRLTVELSQTMQNVSVNGQETSHIKSNITVFGIEGSFQDYILLMSYASTENLDDNLKNDLETLQALVNSFEPLKDDDVEKKRQALRIEGDLNYQKLIENKGHEIFWTELVLLSLRLKGLDPDDPVDRQLAITLLSPFENFAREVQLQDESLDDFWIAMHDAEQGDARNFKARLEEIITSAAQGFGGNVNAENVLRESVPSNANETLN